MLFLGTINTIVQEDTFKKEPLPTVWKTDLKIHFYSDEAWKSNIVQKINGIISLFLFQLGYFCAFGELTWDNFI